MNKQYERKVKENKPVVAICYDFDKTLTPDDMQAQGFIQSVGYDVNSFWEKSNGLAEQNKKEYELDEANFSEEQKLKKSLLLNLEESGSFRTIHTVIAELRKVDYWSPDEIDWLIDIALSNSQVNHILTDDDVARFYKSIIEGAHNKKAEELREVLKE